MILSLIRVRTRIVVALAAACGRLGRALNDVAVRLGRTPENLTHSQKMAVLGQLAGGVAHDFNNELAIIQTNAEFVAANLAADSPARGDLDELWSASARAAFLSKRLLLLARKEVARPELIAPDEMLRDLESVLSRVLDKKIRVRVRRGAPGAVMWVDPSQLEQVVVNLAMNAKDAMPDGGTLDIHTSLVDSTSEQDAPKDFLISMSDTGRGMSEETLERAFEPFFTTKPSGAGIGLGLAVSREILAGIGGAIKVDSKPGRGSRFDLRLPLAANARVATDRVADQDGPGPDQAGERILVAEDQEILRKLVCRVLEKQGYVVTAAANGADALQCFVNDDGIDLLLTDVIMPGMSGLELARRVHERRPELPVILMSGHIPDELDRESIEQGAMAFIGKPFSGEILLQQVQAQLQDRSLRSSV